MGTHPQGDEAGTANVTRTEAVFGVVADSVDQVVFSPESSAEEEVKPEEVDALFDGLLQVG